MIAPYNFAQWTKSLKPMPSRCISLVFLHRSPQATRAPPSIVYSMLFAPWHQWADLAPCLQHAVLQLWYKRSRESILGFSHYFSCFFQLFFCCRELFFIDFVISSNWLVLFPPHPRRGFFYLLVLLSLLQFFGRLSCHLFPYFRRICCCQTCNIELESVQDLSHAIFQMPKLVISISHAEQGPSNSTLCRFKIPKWSFRCHARSSTVLNLLTCSRRDAWMATP